MPVLVQASNEAHSLEQALVENLHRQDLNALEESTAYQQLIEDFNYTHDQVATRVGKSRTSVTNTLRLLQLPAAVQRLLAEGQISAGHARALLGTRTGPTRSHWPSDRGGEPERPGRRGTGEGAVGANEEAEAADPDVTGRPRPKARRRPTGRTRRLPPPGILELEELLSTHLNTRVKVDMTAKRGKVMVNSPPSKISSASTS